MTALARWADRVQTGAFYVLLLMLPISKAMIEITFGVLLISWVVRHAPSGWRSSIWAQRPLQGCALALLAYAGACALSVPSSSYPWLSLNGLVNKTLEYLLFCVIAADVIVLPGVGARSLLVMVCSAGLVAADGLIQEITKRDVFFGRVSGYGRITGPYENPIDLAMYIVVVLPVLLAQAWRHPDRRWRRAAWGVSGLLLWCVVRAHSQGAWLALGGAVIISVLVWSPMRRVLRIGAVVGALMIGLVLRAEGGGIRDPLHLWDMGAKDRVVMWQAAWKMIQDRPVLGQGLNPFMANYVDFWTGGESVPRYAHNCFLQVAAETGVVGLLAFVWVLGALFWWWYRGIQRLASSASTRLLLIGLWTGLLGFVFQAAIDTSFYELRQATLFWVLAGITTGVAASRAPRSTPALAA